MPISSYVKPGLGPRQMVKILTVYPADRKIEASLKDGGGIDIAVWGSPSVFRWPKEEEMWWVRQEAGLWVLDEPLVNDAQEANPLEGLEPGDMRLASDTITDSEGRHIVAVEGQATDGQVATWNAATGRWEPATGSGFDKNYIHNQIAAQTTWTVNHNLGKFPSVTVVDSGRTHVYGDVTHLSINSLAVTFTTAFSGKVYCN